MATSNYYNNDNGIFIVPNSESEDFTIEELEDFQELLLETITAKGYTVDFTIKPGPYDKISVYKGDLIVATIEYADGYYEGVQVIVTTDKDELQDQFEGINGYYGKYYDTPYKWYTPYNKQLLNIIKGLTDNYKVLARFSNGETIYQKD